MMTKVFSYSLEASVVTIVIPVGRMIFRIYPQSLVLNIEAPVFARNMEGGPGVPATERARVCVFQLSSVHTRSWWFAD